MSIISNNKYATKLAMQYKCVTQLARDIQKKIWLHHFYAKEKPDVQKARKMAAGGLASSISPFRVAKPPKCYDFFV